MSIGTGIGLQWGINSTDTVLAFKTAEAASAFGGTHLALGASAGLAFGLGRHAEGEFHLNVGTFATHRDLTPFTYGPRGYPLAKIIIYMRQCGLSTSFYLVAITHRCVCHLQATANWHLRTAGLSPRASMAGVRPSHAYN